MVMVMVDAVLGACTHSCSLFCGGFYLCLRVVAVLAVACFAVLVAGVVMMMIRLLLLSTALLLLQLLLLLCYCCCRCCCFFCCYYCNCHCNHRCYYHCYTTSATSASIAAAAATAAYGSIKTLCGGIRLVGTADLYLLHKLPGLLGW